MGKTDKTFKPKCTATSSDNEKKYTVSVQSRGFVLNGNGITVATKQKKNGVLFEKRRNTKNGEPCNKQQQKWKKFGKQTPHHETMSSHNFSILLLLTSIFFYTFVCFKSKMKLNHFRLLKCGLLE